MIAALKRWLLEREINDLEADIAGIRHQRKMDMEAELMLMRELATARRHLQAMRLAKLNLTAGK